MPEFPNNYNLQTITQFVQNNPAVLLYFSTMSCNVGEALEPKVKDLINTNFPKIKYLAIDLNFSPEVAAAFTAFVEPTVIVFFDGKETIRKSRNIGIYELQQAIERPYKLIFD
jgi:thioredoxin-like negative regulator of GroEL